MAGPGRGRGRELTRPAWMKAETIPPSLPKTATAAESLPSSIASEWATTTAANGRIYWYSKTTGETTWNDPNKSASPTAAVSSAPQIADVWKEHRTPQGRPYYYNSRTGETRWERPSSAVPVPRKVEEEAPLPPGWAKNTAADGRVYYYHSTTRETRWSRPGNNPASSASSALKAATPSTPKRKADVSLSLPPGWIEYHTPDGRPYYYHSASKQTSWTPPSSANEESASASLLEKEHGPRKRPRITSRENVQKSGVRLVRRPRDDEGNPMGNRAAEVWLLGRAQKRRAEKCGVEEAEDDTDGKDMRVDDVDKNLSQFERKQQFQTMLKDRGVSVKSTWLQAMNLCVDDPRYLVLEAYGERKSVFHSFLQKQQRSQRRADVISSLQVQEKLMQFLKEQLKEEPMYRRGLEDCRPDVVKRVRGAAPFRAVQADATRQALVRSFFGERQRENERERAEKRKRLLDKVRSALNAMTDPSIRPEPLEANQKGEGSMEEAVKDSEITELGPPWLTQRSTFREADRRLSTLPFSRDVNPDDVQQIYDDWIRDVCKMADEKRRREKDARKALQRANRAKFRAGVLEMMLNGRVSFRAQWRAAAPEIGKEEFACAENELGERPANLFDDAKDMFESLVHKRKDAFKDLIKDVGVRITEQTTLEELEKVEKLSNFFSTLQKPIVNALLLERQRKEQRRREHARLDFESLLRDLVRRRELTLETSYDVASTMLADKEPTKHFISLAGPETVKNAFEAFILRRRAKEERRSKRRLEEQASTTAVEKRPRLDHRNGLAAIDNLHYARSEDTGWAAAISAKPLTEVQKAEEKERKKRALLATLNVSKGSSATGPKTSLASALAPKAPKPALETGPAASASTGPSSLNVTLASAPDVVMTEDHPPQSKFTAVSEAAPLVGYADRPNPTAALEEISTLETVGIRPGLALKEGAALESKSAPREQEVSTSEHVLQTSAVTESELMSVVEAAPAP